MSTLNRRYDIDWLRVIAIGLLLIYHVAIGFQSWGIMIGFIANEKTWGSLWIPMSMLNIWRIPLLFFVSGMGVYFAMQNRSMKQLFLERAGRILVPFLFGTFAIFPISTLIWQHYYKLDLNYGFHPGHLWFLGNIFVYVVMLSPVFFYLKRNEQGKIVQGMKRVLSVPLGLIPVIFIFIVEALIIDPNPYSLYAMTWHGFFLGLIAFFFGFCFVMAGEGFWKMILRWRWFFLAAGAILFGIRMNQYEMNPPLFMLVIESNFWIFCVFGFGHKYLNQPGRALTYLSQAAYPVYILHMIFLFLGSALIFPLDINVHIQFLLVLTFTGIGSFVTYELIKRVSFLRPLFGLKLKDSLNKTIQ
jgi:glucans biosynthesis protein C